MNERELREAVRARYGQERPSGLVEEAMDRAYESLGQVPKRKESAGRRALRWAGGMAAACAAAFVVLVGVSVANPALAAGVPFLGDIVGFLRGGRSHDAVVQEGAVGSYVQPVASGQALGDQQFQVKDAYFDGEVLLLTTQMDLNSAPEEYRVLQPAFELTFTADGKELSPAYNWRTGLTQQMSRASETSYVGTITLYLLDDVLPDSFELSVKVADLEALDTKHMVKSLLGFGTYKEKTYSLPSGQSFSCTVRRDDSLRKVYEVNETKNGCTLENVTVTPAMTEICLGEDTGTDPETGNSVIMVAYDGDGKQLEIIGQVGDYHHQFFRTLDKDETSVTVKFYPMDNQFDALAEFVVPVEGGWYEEKPQTPWEDDGTPVVYDPPREEESDWSQSGDSTRMVELGETFTIRQGGLMTSGSVDAAFDNLRYYDSWRDAGIADEDMNLPGELKDGLVSEDGYTFVLLDLTLQAHDLTVRDSDENGTKGNLWSADFGELTYRDPELRDLTKGEVICGEGTAYCSEHGNGFTDYYHFFLEGDETKTLQMGYLVKTEELQAGRALVFGHSDDLSSPVPGLEGEAYWTQFHVLPIPPRP